MRKIKRATDVDQQIKILRKRNLKINYTFAFRILNNVNYYKLTYYNYFFEIKKDYFIDGTKFKQIYKMYKFDKALRELLNEILSCVELALKAQITLNFGLKHGVLGYLDLNNYSKLAFKKVRIGNKKITVFRKMISILNDEKNKSMDSCVLHSLKEYGNDLPIWVVMEIVSFGFASKMYKLLPTSVQKNIVNHFNVPYKYFDDWLQGFVLLRNKCSHSAVVIGKKNAVNLSVMKENIEKYGFISPNSLFAYILAIKSVTCSLGIWKSFRKRLIKLIRKYGIRESDIGIPCKFLWELYFGVYKIKRHK